MHVETATLPAHSFVYKGAPSSLSPFPRAHSALSLSNVFFCGGEHLNSCSYLYIRNLATRRNKHPLPRGRGTCRAPRDFIKWTVQWENFSCCQKGRPCGPTYFQSSIFINIAVYPLGLATQAEFRFQKCRTLKSGELTTKKDQLLDILQAYFCGEG